jgi:hypothetical protein
MKDFKIIKYEFITKDYLKNEKYVHWSRIYEWEYVLQVLKKIKPNTIHNTACGGLNASDCLHLTFCDDIDNLVQNTVHSDVWGRDNYVGIKNKPLGHNFIFYDILTKHEKKYNVVLNISTIEHLKHNDRINAIKNLYNQVENGGHLILTFDYPDVDLNQINSIVGIEPLNFNKRVINKNNLSVVLLHIEKTE